MLKKLLLFSILFITGCLNAQTFYWVGGSGYWNDVTHWSRISGGSPANEIPSLNSNVILLMDCLINFDGLSHWLDCSFCSKWK